MIGTVYIKGVIGNCGDVIGVRLLDVVTQVKAHEGATELNVYIDSEGGNVYEGLDIYRYLVGLVMQGITVNTIGVNKVASIASVIFMAGVKRFLQASCKFLIHLPRYMNVSGTAEEILAFQKELKDIENFLVDFYVNTINLDSETVLALLNNEAWMNSKEVSLLKIAEVTNDEMLVVARAEFSDKSITL